MDEHGDQEEAETAGSGSAPADSSEARSGSNPSAATVEPSVSADDAGAGGPAGEDVRAPGERFEDVDWDALEGDVGVIGRRSALYLLVMAGLVALYCYDYFLVHPKYPIYWTNWPQFQFLWWPVYGFNIDPNGVDWLYYAALVTLFTFGVVPVLVHRDRTRAYLRELSKSRLATASLVVVVVFVVLGIVGPTLFPSDLNIQHENQPPFFLTVDRDTTDDCITGWQDRTCHGSMRYPLGSNGYGRGVFRLIISGIGVAFKVSLITTMIAIPIAVAVGTTAGYYGGLVDDVLMRYVDVQQTVPAFLIYLIMRFLFTQNLFLIVVVFGLFSWGGAARLIRSEVVQRREELYVTAAKSAGATPRYLLRHHILPNVSHTVVFSATRLAAMLVLIEAGISFLELNDPVLMSFGETIDNGLEEPFPGAWWISTLPAIALTTIIASLSVFGDALRDAMDPRDPV